MVRTGMKQTARPDALDAVLDRLAPIHRRDERRGVVKG